MSDTETVLTDLRIAVARLEEQIKIVNTKLDLERLAREHTEKQLAPLMESVNKGKGALAAATLIAGAIGATVATGVKHFLGLAPT